MYWLYIVLVCAVSQYLGDMDTEGGPSVQEDETTPLLPLLYIPAPPPGTGVCKTRNTE